MSVGMTKGFLQQINRLADFDPYRFGVFADNRAEALTEKDLPVHDWRRSRSRLPL